MYIVSGSNLFNQWFLPDTVLTEFCVMASNCDCSFDLGRAKLLHINWSYNIYGMDNTFYLSRNGTEKIKKVILPKECDVTQLSNLIISGNEYNLIVASKSQNTLWILNIEQENVFKKINLSIEVPLQQSICKKKRVQDEISKIVVADDSCLCLTKEGNVYSGMLPSYVDTKHCLGKVCNVESGYEHYLILTDTGRVYTWGNGRRLQLGHGDVSNLDSPTEVEALAGLKIIKIKAGGWHSLALSEFGDLYAWGWNDTGQLGIKEQKGLKSYPVPTLVDFFHNDEETNLNVKDIACGSRHSAILLDDNSVWTTGFNKYGQLGLSPERYPSINYFTKAFQSDNGSALMCGPWATVVTSNSDE